MPTSMNDDKQPPLYLVSESKTERCRPCGTDNLTALYGLTDLAGSVARSDPVTGEKKKLRKSYKNQIVDLPGKNIIPAASPAGEWNLLFLARQPRFIQSDPPRPPPTLNPLDKKLMGYALAFDKTPPTGIPGFDASLLSAPMMTKPDPKPVNSPYYQTHARRNGSMAPMTAESSNDDSAMSSRRLKKLKRRDTYDQNSSDSGSKRRKRSET
jgi:mediator of RNA polymerase II transcription subunit 19